MKFSIQIMAREIASAITACAQVVDANSKIPILKTTRISVADGFATFMATNTDQTLIARAACEGDGTVCLDTGAIEQKIRALRADQPVTIEGDDKFVTITQTRTKWKVPVLLDDWPVKVAEPIDAEPVKIGREFVSAIKQAIGIVNPAHPTPALAGIYINDARIMATDAKRLRFIDIAPVGFSFIMPIAVASKIAALVPDGGELRADKNRLSISSPFLTIVSRLVHGEFPDIQRALVTIDGNLKSSAVADAQEMLGALRRAGAINKTGEKQHAFLNMQLRFRSDEVEVYARNSEGEEGNDFSRIEREGDDMDIGVVGNEIIDEIESLECDTVKIEYGDAQSPMKISAVGRELPNFRVLQARAFR